MHNMCIFKMRIVQIYCVSESMCEPANKTKKIYYIHLYPVKCAQLVEVQGSIERSCLASGKTFGCKSGWLMFLPVKDGTASTGWMVMFIAQCRFLPHI